MRAAKQNPQATHPSSGVTAVSVDSARSRGGGVTLKFALLAATV
jgi:hypothetical protein